MNILIASIVTLGVIGCVSAIVLYFVAKKFKVEEDPRIDEVEATLPGANCGGCGYPGCRGFADACVKSDTLDGKLCPVGGQPVMAKVAEILGMSVTESTPKIAVVRCNGSCSVRPRTSNFDGTKSCAITTQLYGGESGCSYGCLGYGDCVDACSFDAIHINPTTGLPEVDEEKCTACGACVKACPKHVIELRNKGPKNRRVFVSCVNRDKGAVARKACSVACIGCGKCAKACPFDAITVENNLAYIDFNKCRLCRKCVAECPTGAIHDINFPTPAPAPEKKVAVETKPAPTITIEKIETPVASAVEVKQEKLEKTEAKETAPVSVVAPEAEKPQQKVETEGQTATPAEPTNATDENQDNVATATIPDKLPDDFDINSLIPDELRVKPREKASSPAKTENKTEDDANMPKLF